MSVNKVILIGRVGKDPDVRTLDGGAKVASLSFATTDKEATPCKMEPRYRNVQNGIILFFGIRLLK